MIMTKNPQVLTIALEATDRLLTQSKPRGRFADFKKALGLHMQTRAGKQRSRKNARLRALYA